MPLVVATLVLSGAVTPGVSLMAVREVREGFSMTDPTDIASRLRSGEACATNPCRVKEAASGCLCAVAADEIERLRAVIRVNALRWIPGITHGDIDALIEGDRP